MMDLITYFDRMERIILGTAGIPVYKSDYAYAVSKFEERHHVPSELRNLKPKYIPIVLGYYGISCPKCHIGFTVTPKEYNDIDFKAVCPCCSTTFPVPHNGNGKVR